MLKGMAFGSNTVFVTEPRAVGLLGVFFVVRKGDLTPLDIAMVQNLLSAKHSASSSEEK